MEIAKEAQRSVYVVLGTLRYIIDNNCGDIAKYERQLRLFQERQSVIEAILQSLSENTQVFLET